MTDEKKDIKIRELAAIINAQVVFTHVITLSEEKLIKTRG